MEDSLAPSILTPEIYWAQQAARQQNGSEGRNHRQAPLRSSSAHGSRRSSAPLQTSKSLSALSREKGGVRRPASASASRHSGVGSSASSTSLAGSGSSSCSGSGGESSCSSSSSSSLPGRPHSLPWVTREQKENLLSQLHSSRCYRRCVRLGICPGTAS
jgi:hypothetical protein